VFTAEQQCAARMLGELCSAEMEELNELERVLANDAVVGPTDRQALTARVAAHLRVASRRLR